MVNILKWQKLIHVYSPSNVEHRQSLTYDGLTYHLQWHKNDMRCMATKLRIMNFDLFLG